VFERVLIRYAMIEFLIFGLSFGLLTAEAWFPYNFGC